MLCSKNIHISVTLFCSPPHAMQRKMTQPVPPPPSSRPSWHFIMMDNRYNNVIHDGRCFRLLVDVGDGKVSTKYLKGITTCLAQKYWPRFNTSKIRTKSKLYTLKNSSLTLANRNMNGRRIMLPKASTDNMSTTETTTMNTTSANKITMARTNRRKKPSSLQAARIIGMYRGTLIHTQLKDYTKLMAFGEHGVEDKKHNYQALHSFNKIHPKCHPCTVLILKTLRDDWGWIPVAAALPVYDPNHLDTCIWATEIDLICVDATNENRLILIEIKTGYDTTFNHGYEPMKNGMKLDNSPLNQAKVQLVASSMLFSAKYAQVRNFSLYVVWCSSDSTCINRHVVSPKQYNHIVNVLYNSWYFQKPNPSINQTSSKVNKKSGGAIAVNRKGWQNSVINNNNNDKNKKVSASSSDNVVYISEDSDDDYIDSMHISDDDNNNDYIYDVLDDEEDEQKNIPFDFNVNQNIVDDEEGWVNLGEFIAGTSKNNSNPKTLSILSDRKRRRI